MDFNSICSIAEKGSVLNLDPCSMNRHQKEKNHGCKRQTKKIDRQRREAAIEVSNGQEISKGNCGVFNSPNKLMEFYS